MKKRLSYMLGDGISQLFLACSCIAMSVIKDVFNLRGSSLYDRLSPEIWCSLYAVFSGFVVISCSIAPSYTRVFWSMFTSVVSSFFVFVLFGLELLTSIYLYTSAIANERVDWYFLLHFGTLGLSLCLLVVCIYGSVVFGRVYDHVDTDPDSNPDKDVVTVTSDTGATLLKISILCIAVSVPAVKIAYGAPYDFTYMARVGAGIWCSVMCGIAGIICYYSMKNQSNSSELTATFAFGIIASVFATGELAVEIGAAVQCMLYQDQFPNMVQGFQMHMIIAACATYQLALSIYIAVGVGQMRSDGIYQEKIIPKIKQMIHVYSPQKNKYYAKL